MATELAQVLAQVDALRRRVGVLETSAKHLANGIDLVADALEETAATSPIDAPTSGLAEYANQLRGVATRARQAL